MNVADLMIGNKVRVYGQNNNLNAPLHWYTRTITVDWLDSMLGYAKNDEKCKERGISYPRPQQGDTEPIQITHDILIANGFDVVGHGDVYTYWKQLDDENGNEVYDITIYNREGSEYYETTVRHIGTVSKHIRYVHELQQALRFCELYDMSNNFIVIQD